MYLNFKEITATQRYFAMVQTIIPRPIAWVLSDGGKAGLNLAPFSFFTGICSDPPLLLLSVGKKPSGDEQGLQKDTAVNIQERKDFVVHIADTESLSPLNQSAATLSHGESELERAGLENVEFEGFSLPRLKGCKVAFGCTLYRLDMIGNTPQAVIYGEIQRLYLCDSIVDQDASRLIVDAKQVDPLAKLGGAHYCGLGDILSALRPK